MRLAWFIPGSSGGLDDDGDEGEEMSQLLASLVKEPGNSTCADCGTEGQYFSLLATFDPFSLVQIRAGRPGTSASISASGAPGSTAGSVRTSPRSSR